MGDSFSLTGMATPTVTLGRLSNRIRSFASPASRKVFTSEAILTLVDRGLLNLDAPAFGLLSVQPPGWRSCRCTYRDYYGASAATTHGRLRSERGGDPIWQVVPIATAMGVTAPADCPTTIRYMLGRALDFDPGTRFAYSNFGYCVLGQVIEAVSGMTYADYVRQSVILPAGITRMALGRTLPSERLAGEVTYYPGATPVPSVFPNLQGWRQRHTVHSMEGRGPNGGWIGSAVDLLKLSTTASHRRAHRYCGRIRSRRCWSAQHHPYQLPP